MPLYMHRYELTPRRALNARSGSLPRHGALLRLDTGHGSGFADLHPWPEACGDAPLDQQLERLAADESTPLTSASLKLAQLDANARQQERSIFDVAGERLPIPSSHLLLTQLDRSWDVATAAGSHFDTVKIKAGRDLAEERTWIEQRAADFRAASISLRLDLNASLDALTFEAWIGSFSREALSSIEFVEDPYPFAAESWAAMRQRCAVAFAVDRDATQILDEAEGVASADVIVAKPAVHDAEALCRFAAERRRRLVITSYMDHPVGQLGAAFIAARCLAEEPQSVGRCGLLTHTLYEPSAFSEAIRADGPLLEPPRGTGVGFDDLLEELPWKRLR